MLDINLREEMKQIIEDHGHYVLLQRTSRKLRCICWDEKLKESSFELYKKAMNIINSDLKTCPKCIGSGWVSRIERVKTRRQLAADIVSMSSRLQTLQIGQSTFDNKLFFFEHDINPKDGDYIYEVGWDGVKPTHLIDSYRIQMTNELREKNGRIEYWQTIAKEDNIGTGIHGFTIKRLGPVVNYEILR